MKVGKSGKRGRGKEGGGAGDPGGSARREGRQTAEGYTAGEGPLGGRNLKEGSGGSQRRRECGEDYASIAEDAKESATTTR